MVAEIGVAGTEIDAAEAVDVGVVIDETVDVEYFAELAYIEAAVVAEVEAPGTEVDVDVIAAEVEAEVTAEPVDVELDDSESADA